MKIVQNCNETDVPKQPLVVKNLPPGTVFKLKGSSNTLLKLEAITRGACANLTSNCCVDIALEALVDLVYPNAKLVLE